MGKILYYGMTGEKMCFQHILMNALDLNSAGHEVKIIFEGASVKLVSKFEDENNPLYRKAKEADLIAGVCMACSKILGVYEANLKTGLRMLDDMSGHAGMKKYIQDGYHVISM
ncbi:MAG: DsrE family protein [Clostridiales bacterium]|nr:DsrE family protein [Clostridiales bacterium]